MWPSRRLRPCAEERTRNRPFGVRSWLCAKKRRQDRRNATSLVALCGETSQVAGSDGWQGWSGLVAANARGRRLQPTQQAGQGLRAHCQLPVLTGPTGRLHTDHHLVRAQRDRLDGIRVTGLHDPEFAALEGEPRARGVGEETKPLQHALAVTTNSEDPAGTRSCHSQPDTTFEVSAESVQPALADGEEKQCKSDKE